VRQWAQSQWKLQFHVLRQLSNDCQAKLVFRPVYTEHDLERERDHERELGIGIGLLISSLYESIYTKGDHERGWKLVRAESRRDFLQSEFLCDGRTSYSTNQFFCFRATRPR